MIFNGVPLYDQNKNTVNAHGAGIIEEKGVYYLFGEYKRDDKNSYNGFSCYSSTDLESWKFEGMALEENAGERLNGNRVGERVKVVKAKATGKFVMLMHTDALDYNDPCICYATSDKVTGPYKFVGPLLYDGQIIKRWDMGTFTEEDGTSYLLTHEGYIYRLSDDCTSATELLCSEFAQGGESPAMCKKNGRYYIIFSNKTSWERNDNYYYTADSLYGPWEKKGLFCPEGSLTFNTQCSFLLQTRIHGQEKVIYLGDRWSFPRQGAAATLVFLPVEFSEGKMSIQKYEETWSLTGEKEFVAKKGFTKVLSKEGEFTEVDFTGSQLFIYGKSDKFGGYGKIEISDENGKCIHSQIVDFYSLVENEGLRYISPKLENKSYKVKITCMGEAGEWFTKSGTRFGSLGTKVELTGYASI